MKLKYYLLLCATALLGYSCNDDPKYNVFDSNIITSVTTGSAETTATTATVSGVVKDLSSQNSTAYTVGVVYSLDEASALAGTRVNGSIDAASGNVTTVIGGLETGRTYYYATFVTLQGRVSYYGDIKAFVTTDAQVGTAEPAAVTSVTANLGGTLNGVSEALEAGTLVHGIAISASPDLAEPVMLVDEGKANSFTCTATELVPNTEYYYAAYMVINDKPVYGNIVKVTTDRSGADASEEFADFVDMGTKYEWAKYNVGAKAENELGGLYGYGDLKGLARSTDNSAYPAEAISGTFNDMALAAGMGFMPTVEDWEALLAITTQKFTSVNGVEGVLLTSTKNGNTLFFPLAGTREGEEVSAQGALGGYWASEISPMGADYGKMYAFDSNGVKADIAQRHVGMSIRPIRKSFVRELEIDNSKLVYGDIEGNGRYRIEIYNEWGASKESCPIDISKLNYEHGMYLTYRITGIDGNLKESAKGTYRSGFQYASGDWGVQYWCDYTGNKFDCVVKGDGEYTLWIEPSSPNNGATVFCADIGDLTFDLIDINKVKPELVQIAIDPKSAPIVHYPIDSSKVLFGNKDGDGVNGRIEIFNEWGETKSMGVDVSDFACGRGTMSVEFTISGIDGNLKDGVIPSYRTDIGFADPSWNQQYWGGESGYCTITGDGTYTAQCYLGGDCNGAIVWVIDINDIWKDLVDTSAVKVTVTDITASRHSL